VNALFPGLSVSREALSVSQNKKKTPHNVLHSTYVTATYYFQQLKKYHSKNEVTELNMVYLYGQTHKGIQYLLGQQITL